MVYIKCERCGIIFNHKNINKRFCDECTKIRTKELVRKSVKKKYHNDKAYREKKKEQVRNKFIRDNFYGLILGTTKLGSHRRWSFDKESKIIRREKKRVLTEGFINMVKLTLKDKHHYFRKYVQGCTYCESCEDICEQKAIRIINPECGELQ